MRKRDFEKTSDDADYFKVENEIKGRHGSYGISGALAKESLKKESTRFGFTDIEINELVDEVKKDFKQRQLARNNYENKWKINMNFVAGNQYCFVGDDGIVNEFDKSYYWQERLVFNHIAPIIESRLAKLSRVRPMMSVRPATDEIRDIQSSKLCKKILDGVSRKSKLSELISKGSVWSEVCGSVFYKVTFSSDNGLVVGKLGDKNIKSGDVEIDLVTPFEIYPDDTGHEDIDLCKSLIHAKAFHIDEIYDKFGVVVSGESVDIFAIDNSSTNVEKLVKSDYATVIEKYVAPSKDYPNGRLIIVASDQLVYYGDLPFINSESGRGFPFVKQVCIKQAGCFWGTSIVERIIPIQRAFNAVRNRKQEFLNRISSGIVAVEDGSVDTDNLESEGLCPGKILVYRQGSVPPSMLDFGKVPSEFSYEEDRLLTEFSVISGVSELMSSRYRISENISGVALQLMSEQDDVRLSCTSDSLKDAIKRVCEMVLRLFKQFATHRRLISVTGECGDVEVFYFSQNDITSFDVVFQTDIESSDSLAQRRSTVLELMKYGIMNDENGNISERAKQQILDMFGFGDFENAKDLISLHIKKSNKENIKLIKQVCDASEIDDHKIHIGEHTRFMLSDDFVNAIEGDNGVEKRFLKHIKMHKAMIRDDENFKGGIVDEKAKRYE